ncbi:unnamed protein product, partial [Rotaria sp. Silwood2]
SFSSLLLLLSSSSSSSSYYFSSFLFAFSLAVLASPLICSSSSLSSSSSSSFSPNSCYSSLSFESLIVILSRICADLKRALVVNSLRFLFIERHKREIKYVSNEHIISFNCFFPYFSSK